MERYTVEIADPEAARALHDAANAHGHSVETEIVTLVQRTARVRVEDNWVRDLIAMTRPGAEINLVRRNLEDRVVPFRFDDFN